MDTASEKDLLYLANVMERIQRPKDGLELIEKLSKIKPAFNVDERTSFSIIFKAAVDKIRNSLRVLNENLLYEEENSKPEHCERIKEIINESFSDLQKLCNNTLEMLDNQLLPNAESPQAKVCFLKLKGDIYRYLTEFAEGDEKEIFLAAADEAYSSALPIALSELKKSDTVRLGLILNYAVFKYEHKQAYEEAKDLLNKAIELLNNDFSDVSPDTENESKSIIEVMQNNLQRWNQSEEEEEES